MIILKQVGKVWTLTIIKKSIKITFEADRLDNILAVISDDAYKHMFYGERIIRE